MIRARYIHYPLHFHRPAGTSRGILKTKDCWYLFLENKDGTRGIGEVSFIPELSPGSRDEITLQLDRLCKRINGGENIHNLINIGGMPEPMLPGICFALETAVTDLENPVSGILFPSGFTRGEKDIPVNGLVWMGTISFMRDQVADLVHRGFKVLKIKVGALEFESELELLAWIRRKFPEGDLELRLDANGAWAAENAPAKLEALSRFRIHSIEQPIRNGQTDQMAALCRQSPIPVTLDEELIGLTKPADMKQLLETIRPAYIVIKPGLLGGFRIGADWVRFAGECGTGWWITSALESNVGLNAIAQWTATLDCSVTQGLGTGTLYQNNLPSPLELNGPGIRYRPRQKWDLNGILQA